MGWQQLSSFFLGRWDDPDSDDDDGSKPQIIDPTCCGNLWKELCDWSFVEGFWKHNLQQFAN